ncbi:MAG TPA: PaaI family thioesterase [Polyangiaceae bacterium]|nr:PaaI family thioesterase [Polyangiaceae bacterium]
MANDPQAPPAAGAAGDDQSETLNAMVGGWDAAMAVRFVRATPDEVVAELPIGPAHLQAYGIVHGGVYAGLIEVAASTGATLSALAHGRLAVGLENHTSFLHATRSGTLRAVARPLSRGRTTQVWEATVTDDRGRAVATGRVRLLALEQGQPLAGDAIGLAAREG